jgi:flavodoxin
MNATFFILITIATILSTVGIAQSQETEDSGKVLVAYFTHTNNTKVIAEQIHKKVGGDIFQIITVNSYPDNYNQCIEKAKKEQKDDYRPELQKNVENMAAYEVVYLGYPTWWGSIPMPVATFLESYDFSGKTIIPFCTHEGSRLGSSETFISKLAPKAILKSGLAVQGSKVNSAESDVESWLNNLGTIK